EKITDFDKLYLLFTGQGQNIEVLLNFFKNSVSFLKENGLLLLFKPHPAENENISISIKEFCMQNPEQLVYYEGKSTTLSLIANSIAHISISSFCHFDAVNLLGKTYLLDLPYENNIFETYCDEYKNSFI